MRRTMAGGAKKRPTRYDARPGATSTALADALRAHRKGEIGRAREGYLAVLESEPECLDAWVNLATLAVLAGRAREAIEAFARAAELAPADARVLRDAGIGLAALGAHLDARAYFARSLAAGPELAGALLGLSRVCADMGDRDAAVAYASRAVAAWPEQASTHLELHRACFDDRSPDAAVAAARRAVDLDPGYALARYFLAGAVGLTDPAACVSALLGDDAVVAAGLRDVLTYVLGRERPLPRVFATRAETLRFAMAQAELDGPVLEFGVRHGVSTRVLAECTGEIVHAFDVFTGLPERWQGREVGAFGTSGELPELPAHVHLHVGLFADTLPDYLARRPAPPRLVHIDSDLYESARTVLRALGRSIGPGCVLVFDEYIGNADWRQDEHRAFCEAAAALGWRYDEIALSWITGQGVVRIVAVDGTSRR